MNETIEQLLLRTLSSAVNAWGVWQAIRDAFEADGITREDIEKINAAAERAGQDPVFDLADFPKEEG